MAASAFDELKWRGLVYDCFEGVDELLLREQVTVYNGFDATADSLHVGHMVPLIALARRIEPAYRELRAWEETNIQSVDTSAGQRIAEARFAVHGKTMHPDATRTLRLSYGRVLGYAEGTTRVPYRTTFFGLFDRAESFEEKPPYDLPPRYRAVRGTFDLATPLNFVYTADTIGGNSGSPIVNRQGEIVGVNFDSNIQKLANRYVYVDEEEGGRAVAVHSVGILRALREIYGAEGLAGELGGR